MHDYSMFFYPNYIYVCFSSNKTSIQRLKTRLPSLRGLSVEALGDHGPSQSLLGHQGGADAFELLQPHLPAGRNRKRNCWEFRPLPWEETSMAIFHGKLLEYKGLASKQWHLETSSGWNSQLFQAQMPALHSGQSIKVYKWSRNGF